MIEVQMAEAEMQRAHVLRLEPQAERPDASAGVEDDDRAVGETDLHARCVAAIAHGVGPRRGERAAASPHTRLHAQEALPFESQKMATAPTNSSLWANSGKAVISISRSLPSWSVMRSLPCAARRLSRATPGGSESRSTGEPSAARGE